MLHDRINILVIEDNPGDYLLVNEYLEESFPNSTLFHTDTLQQGIKLIEKEHIDVILLDLTLPDGMGIDSFHSINSKAPQVPVIILTGLGDTELALESLKIGAQDYIVKDDANPVVLAKSIQYGIERSKIIDHLKKSEEQYKYLFYNNPLPMFASEIDSQTMLMVNEAAIRHYGYSEEEFLKMRTDDLVFRKEGAKQPSSSGLVDDKGVSIDLQHKKRNGEVIDVEVVSHEIIAEGKNACLAVIHDVTERNKAKEQLRESDKCLEPLLKIFLMVQLLY
jgi:PAS domain S-box-containing protein